MDAETSREAEAAGISQLTDDTDRSVTAGPTRLARLGLIVMSAGPIVAAVGDPGVLVFAGPMIVLPAIGAFLVSRYGRWAHLVAALLGLLGLAIALPGAWVFTDAPDSFFDVVPTAMFLLGGIAAVVGGVSSTVGRWRDARFTRGRPVVLGAIAAVALASGGLALSTSSEVDPEALATATEVHVDDRGFDPEELALRQGETVTLAVYNDGRIAHTFTSAALDVDIVLSPGEVALAAVTVPMDVDGLQYWCVPHSNIGDDGRREWMVGELAAAD